MSRSESKSESELIPPPVPDLPPGGLRNPNSFFENLEPDNDEEEKATIKTEGELEEELARIKPKLEQQLEADPVPRREELETLNKKITSLKIMQSLTMDENLENYILFEEFFTNDDLEMLEHFFDDYKPKVSPMSRETTMKFKMQMRKLLSMLVLYSKYYNDYKWRPYLLRNVITNESYITLIDEIRQAFIGYPDYPGETQPVIPVSRRIYNAFEKFFTKNEKTRKKILENLFDGTLMVEVYNNLIKPKIALSQKTFPILSDQEIIGNIKLLLENETFYILPFIEIFQEPFTPQKIAVRKSLDDVCTSLGKAYNVLDLSDPPLIFPRVLPDETVYRGGLKKSKNNKKNSKKNNRKLNKTPKKTYKKGHKIQRKGKINTIKTSRPLQKGKKTIRNHSKTI
jgi:hypothetical protein